MDLTKLSIARHQLGTATALFLDNADPVSVHCLACGAAEIVESLGFHTGTEIFTNHVIQQRPELAADNRRGLRTLRNRYWNAFKHASSFNGKSMRDDADVLDQFDDAANDHALFVGWGDYGPIAGRLPIEAQVFEVWFMVLYEEKVSPEVDLTYMRAYFPNLRSLDRSSQKVMLRNVIVWARQQNALMATDLTDPDPLILGAYSHP